MLALRHADDLGLDVTAVLEGAINGKTSRPGAPACQSVALAVHHCLDARTAGTIDAAGRLVLQPLPAKDDLALEAVRRYADGGNPLLTDTSMPPLERLRRHFETISQGNAARGFTRGCMLGNFTTEIGDHNPLIRTAVREAFTAWVGAIADVLIQARDEGALRPGLEPVPTARFIVKAWEGALIETRAYQSGEAFENFFTTVFGLLLPSSQ